MAVPADLSITWDKDFPHYALQLGWGLSLLSRGPWSVTWVGPVATCRWIWCLSLTPVSVVFPCAGGFRQCLPCGETAPLRGRVEGKRASLLIHDRLSDPEDGGALDNPKGGQGIFRLSVQKNSSVQLPLGMKRILLLVISEWTSWKEETSKERGRSVSMWGPPGSTAIRLEPWERAPSWRHPPIKWEL